MSTQTAGAHVELRFVPFWAEIWDGHEEKALTGLSGFSWPNKKESAAEVSSVLLSVIPGKQKLKK